MEIIFSKHATRRMALYGIQQIDIANSIETHIKLKELVFGKNEFIDVVLKERYKLPIKIVVDIAKHAVTVITVYPLKKGITR